MEPELPGGEDAEGVMRHGAVTRRPARWSSTFVRQPSVAYWRGELPAQLRANGVIPYQPENGNVLLRGER